MANIGGNITGTIQILTDGVKNAIGEAEAVWSDVTSVFGWLSLQSGDSKYSVYNAKIEESSHVFLCDYNSTIYALADRNCRMVFKGFLYDVLLIDNPDEMNEQLEIYLRRVGAYSA